MEARTPVSNYQKPAAPITDQHNQKAQTVNVLELQEADIWAVFMSDHGLHQLEEEDEDEDDDIEDGDDSADDDGHRYPAIISIQSNMNALTRPSAPIDVPGFTCNSKAEYTSANYYHNLVSTAASCCSSYSNNIQQRCTSIMPPHLVPDQYRNSTDLPDQNRDHHRYTMKGSTNTMRMKGRDLRKLRDAVWKSTGFSG